MSKKAWLFFLFFIILFVNRLTAQPGGKATYRFLDLTNAARIAALGGSNVSISDDDLNFAYHNPALLDTKMHNHIVLNYVRYFADIQFGYASYARHVEGTGNFAVGIHHINYGDFIAADQYGNKTGSFKAAEYAINLMYSRQIIDSLLQIGVNLKPVISNLERYTSWGLLADLGVHYYNHDYLLGVSLVLRNAGSQIEPYYEGHYEPVPLDLQFGITKRLAHAPFRFSMTLHHLQEWDLTYKKEDEEETNVFFTGQDNEGEKGFERFSNRFMRHLIFGLEFLPSENFFVNLGYNHQRRKELLIESKPGMTGFSWGFGLKISKFRLSYGRASYHVAGGSNHFSLSVNPSEFYMKKKNKSTKSGRLL